MPVERWLEELDGFGAGRRSRDADAARGALCVARTCPYPTWPAFHLLVWHGRGYIKDPQQREEYLAVIRGWQEEVDKLEEMLA